jgi:hypothetical protein
MYVTTTYFESRAFSIIGAIYGLLFLWLDRSVRREILGVWYVEGHKEEVENIMSHEILQNATL